MDVGLVGVGIMGSAVGEALVDAGVALGIHDIRPEVTLALSDKGAHVAASAAELARAAPVVLVLVQTDEQCEQVVGEVVAAARVDAVVVVLSTIHPDTARHLAEQAATRGVGFVEAPLAGKGSQHLGEMLVLAAGDPGAMERARPVLAVFAGQVLAVGPVGSAATLKLAHNVVVYLTYQALVEARALARSGGADPEVLRRVLAATGALSEQSDLYLDMADHVAGGTPEEVAARVATYADILDKDLGHAVDQAGRQGIELPGAAMLVGRGAQVYAEVQ